MQHVTARVALIISALIATGVAASAADGLPPPARVPGFTWTGFYIGVNGGYGNAAFEDATVTTSDGTISRGGGGQAKGGIVGGQIGVNYQVGAGVFGIEADGQWSGQSYTSSSIFCGATCTLTETAKVTSFATLRGRAGLATDRGLLYATAGGVWTSGSDQFVAAVGSTNTTISNGNGNKVGWTVGGGVEAAFYDNWSMKLEYLYIATKNLTGGSALPLGLGTVTESANVRDNIIRVGINYRFGPTGLVAY